MAQAGTVFVDVLPSLSKFGPNLTSQVRGMSGAFAPIQRLGTAAFQQIGEVAKGAAVAIGAVGAASAVAGFDTAANLETATLQFETLMGSAEEAEAHVRGLFDFAAKTPFETGPIIEASRLMQVFGGDALNTSENLAMIGDTAAATGNRIEEIAFWVGRANSAIQAGRPWGEAAMRLQELGVLSGEARNRVEELSAAGASSEEVWAALTDELERFDGAMIKQAGTWKGLTSTMMDTFKLTSADVWAPLFESTKNLMAVFIDFANSPAFGAITDGLRSIISIGSAALDGLTERVEGFLGSLKVGEVNKFFDSIVDAVSEASEAFDGLEGVVAGLGIAFGTMFAKSIPLIGGFVPAINPVFGALAGLLLSSEEGRDAMVELGQAFADVAKDIGPELGAAFRDIAETLGPVLADSLKELGPALAEVARAAGELVAAGGPALAEGIATLAPAVTSLLSAGLEVLAPALDALASSALLAGPAVGALAGAMIGGPWGAAIGGVVGLLGGLIGGFDDTARSADEAERAIRGLTSAMLEQNSIGKVATLDALGEAFQELEGLDGLGIVGDLDAIGVSLSDIQALILAGPHDVEAFKSELRELGEAEGWDPERIDAAVDGFGRVAGSMTRAANEAAILASAQNDVGYFTGLFNEQAFLLAGQLNQLGGETLTLSTITPELNAGFETMAFNAGAASREAYDLTGSMESATAAGQPMVQSLLDSAATMLGSEQAAFSYAAQLFQIPPERFTGVTNTGDAARVIVEELIRKYGEIPGGPITTNVDANTAAAWAAVDNFIAQTNARSATVPVYATTPSFPAPGSYIGGPVPGGEHQPVPMTLHGGEYVLSKDVVDRIKKGRSSRGADASTSTTAGGGGSLDASEFHAAVREMLAGLDRLLGDYLDDGTQTPFASRAA